MYMNGGRNEPYHEDQPDGRYSTGVTVIAIFDALTGIRRGIVLSCFDSTVDCQAAKGS